MKPPQNVRAGGRSSRSGSVRFPTRPGHFALRAALREFKHLVEKGMTQRSSSSSGPSCGNTSCTTRPTTSERLGYALDDRFYGIAGSHLELYRKTMDELTLEEVNAAIRKHWQFGNMQIAFITTDAAG